MKKFVGFERGMGMGGWLTNYKRFHLLSEDKREILTIGDLEHFQSYITERDVQYIASLGFDHIRLGFDQVVLQDENGNFIDEHFRLIENFLGWCKKYGLNAVLNLHKARGSYCDVESDVSILDSAPLQERFVEFWIEFERRFASFDNAAFELLNEVRDEDPKKWNDLVERTLKAVRALNKDRIIVVGTTCWNSPDRLSVLRLYDDENVVYTFHYYAPNEFTHQRGVLQAAQIYYNRDMPYPGEIERYRDFQRFVNGAKEPYAKYTEMGKEYTYDKLASVKEFIKAHPDKILWCGEFGNIRHAKLEWRIAWFKDVISFLKENDIPYSVWNYLSTPNDGNRFSLVDDDKREILSEELKDVLLGNF